MGNESTQYLIKSIKRYLRGGDEIKKKPKIFR